MYPCEIITASIEMSETTKPLKVISLEFLKLVHYNQTKFNYFLWYINTKQCGVVTLKYTQVHVIASFMAGMPNLFFKGATSTQWNIFGGHHQQFKLKWCTVSPVVLH